LSQQPQNVARAAVSGVRWNYLGSLAMTFSSLLIGAVLARLLGPKPFGRVLIAMTVYGFVNLFTDGGISLAIVQCKELSTSDLRRIFTFQALLGFSLAGVIALAAPVIARLFHDPGAVNVVRVLSLMIAVQGLGLTSSAMLRRQMRFKTLQKCNLAGYLVGYLLLGIPLALRGAGVWSLVAAYLTQVSLSYALMYYAVRHPLAPCFRLPPAALFSFGRKVILTNLANWCHVNLDNVAASQGQGPGALGLYGRIYSFAFMPSNAVVTSLQSVLLSSTAKVHERRETVGEMTLAALAVILAIVGPAYATFALIPRTIITGIYGPKWIAGIPLATPLAISILVYACMSMLGPVLSGLGKPERELWPQAATATVAAATFFTAARHSLLALAWSVCAVNILRLLALLFSAFSLLSISWMRVCATFARGAVFSLLFGASVWLLDRGFTYGIARPEARLALIFPTSIALLLGALWLQPRAILGPGATDFLLRYSSALPSLLRNRLQAMDGSVAAAGKQVAAARE
jgi:O-antigen/teichoic acid export membrane protein